MFLHRDTCRFIDKEHKFCTCISYLDIISEMKDFIFSEQGELT